VRPKKYPKAARGIRPTKPKNRDIETSLIGRNSSASENVSTISKPPLKKMMAAVVWGLILSIGKMPTIINPTPVTTPKSIPNLAQKPGKPSPNEMVLSITAKPQKRIHRLKIHAQRETPRSPSSEI
jgi:hypothetical protein